MENPSEWRQSTFFGVPYRKVEMEGEVSRENTSVTETYIIRSSDLLTMIRYAFPEPVEYYGTLFYPNPPRLPGLSTLVPNQINFESFDDGRPIDPFFADVNAPTGTYSDYIRLIVDYGPNPANDSDQDPNNPFTFLEVSADASGSFLNSPMNGEANWVPVASDESTEVQEANIPYTVTESTVEWTVRWPQVPFTFWNGKLMARIRNRLGMVNSSSIPLLHNAPAETILFLGYKQSTSFTWREGRVGQAPVSIEMKFLEKNFISSEGIQVTHQHIWRPNHGWRRLLINGNSLHMTTNLNSVWSTS